MKWVGERVLGAFIAEIAQKFDSNPMGIVRDPNIHYKNKTDLELNQVGGETWQGLPHDVRTSFHVMLWQ